VSLVFVHFNSIAPEGLEYYTLEKHPEAKSLVLRFYTNFIKKISLDDYYFFIVTQNQKAGFEECLKQHGVTAKDIYAKGSKPVQNMRYPTQTPTLNWYILKVKEQPSKFSPLITAWL